jgi:heme exporter protein C
LTFFSIRIFRTIHPVIFGSASAMGTGLFEMSPRMLQTFLFSLFTFTVLFISFYWHRLRLGLREQDRDERLARQAQLEEEE